MPRTVNAQEHTEKRNEILDVAQRLVYTKGYEPMTIQDILVELGISKGAFYHYFASKQELLEALIERFQREGEAVFAAIVHDPTLPIMVKLQRAFDVANRWKLAQKEYLLNLFPIWTHDHNAIVRQKTQARVVALIGPLITEMVVQGCAEGVLSTPFPEESGRIIYALLFGYGEAFIPLFLSSEPGEIVLAKAIRLTEAYNDAVERVIGAPPGSLHLIDPPTLAAWFAAAPAQVAA